MDERKIVPEDLICYCGYYGGSCALWCGYPHFREAARLLAEWTDSMGFQYWMPDVVDDFEYDEFRKGLEFLGRERGGLRCTKCCRGGEGNPHCEVRNCCKDRELHVCFDCDDITSCEKIKKFPKILKRFEEYKLLGREKWLKQQVEKAEKGFELHTEKYYTIQTENPAQK